MRSDISTPPQDARRDAPPPRKPFEPPRLDVHDRLPVHFNDYLIEGTSATIISPDILT